MNSSVGNLRAQIYSTTCCTYLLDRLLQFHTRKPTLLLQNPAPEYPIQVNNCPTTLVKYLVVILDTLSSFPFSLIFYHHTLSVLSDISNLPLHSIAKTIVQIQVFIISSLGFCNSLLNRKGVVHRGSALSKRAKKIEEMSVLVFRYKLLNMKPPDKDKCPYPSYHRVFHFLLALSSYISR